MFRRNRVRASARKRLGSHAVSVGTELADESCQVLAVIVHTHVDVTADTHERHAFRERIGEALLLDVTVCDDTRTVGVQANERRLPEVFELALLTLPEVPELETQDVNTLRA